VNRHVNAIAGRLSLRAPQRRSLEILDRLTEIAPPQKDADAVAALTAIRSEYPSVTDFEREFPSVCFALATGVDKTRLMGAFISYLHLAHEIDNFFVLAPNLTIYDKLITDFTPNTSKYVFRGIAEFATEPPEIITGDNYEQKAGSLFSGLVRCKINVFNISKINSEVRGGKAPRIKRLSEYIGESYFEYLSGLPDLVLLMDESHRYRADAGVKAINELKPILGLELTATPVVERRGGNQPFANVIYDYPLGQAMADGFVKEPAVVTRRNFNPDGMEKKEIELLKLEDGVRLHEKVKVDLETYARETGKPIVKPFVLVVAEHTTHAASLLELIESDAFFEGRYRGKVVQVDSSRTGAEEEKMIATLLRVEHADEPTEIVIHVNMLKEGWDVTNLYTIVPLRAADARVLVEQTIGRGLRLPYGSRTGVEEVDTLNIVAHDRFQEIVDEARRPGSAIRFKTRILDSEELSRRTRTVVSEPEVLVRLGLAEPVALPDGLQDAAATVAMRPAERAAAQAAYDVIRELSSRPVEVPTLESLQQPEIKREIERRVAERVQTEQLGLGGILEPVNIAAVVASTLEVVAERTIGIPRVVVVPRGEVRSGFHPFTLELDGMRYPEVSDDLWIQEMRTGVGRAVTLGDGGIEERRLEDYVVAGLVDYDDVSYDQHSDLLYDLAGQVVRHFLSYLPEAEVARVLRCHQKAIARNVHSQMMTHAWEEAAGYDAQISRSYVEIIGSAYTQGVADGVADYRVTPTDKSAMSRLLFGGFRRCLFRTQKFDSDPERRLAVILERDALKWFRPGREQLQIFYRIGVEERRYHPDFVVETAEAKLLLEPKAASEMESPEVLAKRDAAVRWCREATGCGGKPWIYALIPHDAISENADLPSLLRRFACC